MRKINKIVIHCSASPDGQDIGFLEINSWHLKNGWKSDSGIGCGYHFIIRRTGVVELGRTPDEAGAHVQGHNFDSVGVCLVGTNHFSDAQIESCKRIINSLKKQYDGATVHAHNEFDSAKKQGKTCPNIDINKLL